MLILILLSGIELCLFLVEIDLLEQGVDFFIFLSELHVHLILYVVQIEIVGAPSFSHG